MDADTTLIQWPCLIKQLQANPASVPIPLRQKLADSLGHELLQGTVSCEDTLFLEMSEQLAKDPDWQVRLAVSRQLHLFDQNQCTDLIVQLCSDDNTYVRKNAERSLKRQVKFNQKRYRENRLSQEYLSQINKMVGQYGPDIADHVHKLAEYRSSLLATTLAHDFRSILTTLSANVESLLAENTRHRRTKSIRDDLNLLEQTIENMELFVKPLNVAKYHEDLGEVIDTAIEKAQVKIAKLGYDINHIQIQVEKPDRIRIRIARQLLLLALTNLIKNAYESFDIGGASLSEGQIFVRVIVCGFEIQIIIEDTGPGIEPDVLEELKTFTRRDINKTKRESTGFGLPIAYKYVSVNNGILEIDSQLGRGTTIRITLPLKDTEE